MKKTGSVAENLIKIFVGIIMAMIVFFLMIAIFDSGDHGEAEIGNFDSKTFNDGWIMEMNGDTKEISLPFYFDAKDGDILVIRNTLPDNLPDNSCIMAKTYMEDMYIYINGVCREQYASENAETMPYYLPGAYLVADLSSNDAGADIAIEVHIKSNGVLNEIRLGQGGNVWFEILKKNLSVNVVTFVVLVMGVLLIITAAIMQHYVADFKPSFFLGFLMLDIAIWQFSESSLKQLFFIRPSLTCFFTYLSFELFGVLTCLFFDEVQNRKHHNSYLIIESIVCVQLTINLFLHFAHIAEFHQTLVFSHIWLLVELVCVIVNVASDIRAKRLSKYKTTAIGMVAFLLLSLVELLVYYFSESTVFGKYVSVGLIILTIATVIQVFVNQIRVSREHQNEQKTMLIGIIETIAGAIDAKDEYTGGHSERVGNYSAILAEAVADKYNFSKDDILRIHYIGNMHDIGKIGVSESILNKAGRLTDDEFGLIKKHVDIGAELVLEIGDSIEGLVDGIKYHHERYDGKGYPEGLKGTKIPLVARIICLADCYDAMTSNRVYRKRLSDEEVRNELIKCSGTQFDSELTEVFISLIDSGKMVSHHVGIAKNS